MEKFKYLPKDKISRLPKTSGVYALKKGAVFLYIGKAANIKERVKNHFQQPAYRDHLFVNQVSKIGYITTDSEIEALLLESRLIKKYQPKYNVMWRDDKNYFFVGITKEGLPRVLITHQVKKFQITKSKFQTNSCVGTGGKTQIPTSIFIGPFVEGSALKKTLRILRKVFPYYTAKKHPQTYCPWCHLKLCPGPSPDKKEYRKNIRNLVAVLKGKRQSVLKNLKKEMKFASKNEDYEKAGKIRDQIEALEKVVSHAKIFEPLQTNFPKSPWCRGRIEAYDVSNIQGEEATGAMVTFVDGRPDKNFYRRFKIKIAGKPNDVAMLKEVLSRRFNHQEWPYPDLILIDGGKPQLSAAVNSKLQFPNSKRIKVMAIAKKKNELFIEGQKKPILLKNLPREIFNLILRLRDEAHRFALSYHKKLREIDLRESI